MHGYILVEHIMNKNNHNTAMAAIINSAFKRIKPAVITGSGIILTACVAGPVDNPQSSEPAASSQAVASSSSVVVVSSSSVTVASSSSQAAASSPVDCSVADAGAGAEAFVGSSCSVCHGGVNEAAGTTPGNGQAGPAINVNNFVKFDENSTSLNVYISTQMMNFGGGCAAGDAACEAKADNIATYLKSLSNNPWCESAPISSAPVSSSSAAPVISSSSSSAPDQAAGPGTVNTLLTSSGEFTNGVENFTDYIDAPTLATINWSGAVDVTINNTSTQPWHIQVIHDADIRAGISYTLCYDAKAEFARDIEINIDNGPDGSGSLNAYNSVVSGAIDVSIGTNYERYTHTFTGAETDSSARVLFNLGISDGDVSIDNIGLYHGTQCNQENRIPPPPQPPEPGVADPSAGCGQAPGQLGSSNSGIPIGNAGNAYYVTLPQNYDRNKPYPLFFVHHPSGGSGLTWGANGAGFSNEAKANSIMVYPKAINISGGWHSNDDQMFEPLYNRITSQFCVNKAAVFATGYSSGGDYSGYLGCEHADKLTAIAPTNTKPLGGGRYPLTNPANRSCSGNVRAVILHNERDTLVGGTHGKLMTDFYRAKNGCSSNSTPYPITRFTGAGRQCVTYQGCMDGFEVSYCSHDASYGNPPTHHGYPAFTGDLLWEIAKEYL